MTKPPRKPAAGDKRLPPWMPESARSAAPAKPTKGGPGKKASGPGKTKGPARVPSKSPFSAGAGGKFKGGPGGKSAPRGPRQADPHADREAGKYAQPIISREALIQFLGDAPGPLTAEEIARALKLTADDRYEALSRRLNAMLRDGQLLMNRRGGFAVVEQLDLIAGVVIANPEGFGFLKPEKGGDDLFLPPGEMRKVMHGDRALASVTNVDHRGRREGAIVEVLERRMTRIVGRYSERAGIGTVIPDDRRVLIELLIPTEDRNGAKEGQLVVCEITTAPERGRQPIGKVLVVLGDKLTPSRVVEMAIHGHNLPHEFNKETLAEAAAVALDVPANVANARVDLRKIHLVTIDGEDAKDFDDAVYCAVEKTGFRLIVAIADVSHYVHPGTALDDEAVLRSTSVYFPGFVVPMLPETLSNGICSLKPKVDRLCFVCDMHIDFEGQVTASKFYEAVMNSHARLTYTQVWKAIEKDPEALATVGALMPDIERLHQLYQVLKKARSKRGAIEFESGETRFVLDDKGEVIQAGMLERNDAHKLIEECMIAANVEAARFILSKKIPAPFRVHDRPPESKYADLLEYLSEFGLRLPPWGQVQPKDFTTLLKKIRERPDAALLETVLLRSQSMAVYSTENKGHFGLALEAYGHFTSPIRRYPDLLLHRSIKHALIKGSEDGFGYSGAEMAVLCLQCSEKERRADEASREVDERYRSAWMEKHVGSEFDGVISGVTSFGLFVELVQSKVNGLVHVTQLPHDYYHFDPLRKSLKGERKGTSYRLGDPVRVIVMKASVEDKRIDFKLVEPKQEQGERKKKAWAE
ncbi:MAG TPA: ribonuclease R [Arenimonas sp.]|uniref:ribonuclease R n=1 Tax=Arenimonas sp. TaxID=1872635 RepID=UPI002C6535F5|nr:ribonuclease R [Arenimonas sp.]HMB57152.1 ribonuclease R [Arenimonas sp.]